ncbi:MAG: transposase [Halanaerobiales bacterium]|nr:transposase [Halanaerobiales bacterium]
MFLLSEFRKKVIFTVKIASKEIKKDNNNYLSIDLVISNLISCYCNKTKESFIIDGVQHLSTNRYFAKKIKYYQSILNGRAIEILKESSIYILKA